MKTKSTVLLVTATALSLFITLTFSKVGAAEKEINTETFNLLYSLELGEKDILPDGTAFTYGQPIWTNEFSDDGSYEFVTIEEEVEINPLSTSSNLREMNYGTYIGRAYWITRNKVKSISIYPNKNAKGWTKEKAWNELKKNFSFYKDWKNETSLKKQFNCHARTIPPYTGKIPWNIEPSKKATSVITCN